MHNGRQTRSAALQTYSNTKLGRGKIFKNALMSQLDYEQYLNNAAA